MITPRELTTAVCQRYRAADRTSRKLILGEFTVHPGLWETFNRQAEPQTSGNSRPAGAKHGSRYGCGYSGAIATIDHQGCAGNPLGRRSQQKRYRIGHILRRPHAEGVFAQKHFKLYFWNCFA